MRRSEAIPLSVVEQSGKEAVARFPFRPARLQIGFELNLRPVPKFLIHDAWI